MVAVVSGSGLGLLDTQQLLDKNGSSLGQANLNVQVNAVTGNLILQSQDELLVNQGIDSRLIRTYNSLGQFDDDNGDNHRFNFNQYLHTLTGTVNTSGSTITLVRGDGHETVFTYDTAQGCYVSTEGEGAHDTLDYDGTSWTYTEGSSQATQTFESDPLDNTRWRLHAFADAEGLSTSLVYNAAGHVSEVHDVSGQILYIDYVGDNVEKIRTETNGVVTSEVYYTYDAEGRLKFVKTDLNPQDGSIHLETSWNGNDALANVYVTRYSYEDTENSSRVTRVQQFDGTEVNFTYDANGRIATVTQGSGTDAIVTRFDYTSSTTTDIVTVAGVEELKTTITFDADDRATQILSPANEHGYRLATNYAYDADGNITSVSSADSSTTYIYDENGNLERQQSLGGQTVDRTYSANNQLLTETVYTETVFDQSTGEFALSGAQTTHYVYDTDATQNNAVDERLRFVVAADGAVTETRYSGIGVEAQRTLTTLTYMAKYTGTDFSEAALEAWVAETDATTSALLHAPVSRQETVLDFRGQISSTTVFANLNADGTGIWDGEESTTYFVYDQYGQLLKTIDPRGQNISSAFATANNYETNYLYDGMGRLLSTVDSEGYVTVTRYNGLSVETRYANGLVTTNTYNSAGLLVSTMQAKAANAASLQDTQHIYRLEQDNLTYVVDDAGFVQAYTYDEITGEVIDERLYTIDLQQLSLIEDNREIETLLQVYPPVYYSHDFTSQVVSLPAQGTPIDNFQYFLTGMDETEVYDDATGTLSPVAFAGDAAGVYTGDLFYQSGNIIRHNINLGPLDDGQTVNLGLTDLIPFDLAGGDTPLINTEISFDTIGEEYLIKTTSANIGVTEHPETENLDQQISLLGGEGIYTVEYELFDNYVDIYVYQGSNRTSGFTARAGFNQEWFELYVGVSVADTLGMGDVRNTTFDNFVVIESGATGQTTGYVESLGPFTNLDNTTAEALYDGTAEALHPVIASNEGMSFYTQSLNYQTDSIVSYEMTLSGMTGNQVIYLGLSDYLPSGVTAPTTYVAIQNDGQSYQIIAGSTETNITNSPNSENLQTQLSLVGGDTTYVVEYELYETYVEVFVYEKGTDRSGGFSARFGRDAIDWPSIYVGALMYNGETTDFDAVLIDNFSYGQINAHDTSTTTQVVAGSERQTQYHYDAAGNLRATIAPDNSTNHYLYNGAGQHIADIDATGAVISYEYNADGKLVQKTQFSNKLSSVSYSELSNQVVAGEFEELDASSWLQGKVSADGFSNAGQDRVEDYIYDLSGQLVYTIDAEGYLVEYQYDAAGNQLKSMAYDVALTDEKRQDFVENPYLLISSGSQASVISEMDNTNRVIESIGDFGFVDEHGLLVYDITLNVDGSAQVVEYLYDEHGNDWQKRIYSTVEGIGSSSTLEDVKSAVALSTYAVEYLRIFDNDNQAKYFVNENGLVSEYIYDDTGLSVTVRQHSRAIKAEAVAAVEDIQQLMEAVIVSDFSDYSAFYEDASANYPSIYALDGNGRVVVSNAYGETDSQGSIESKDHQYWQGYSYQAEITTLDDISRLNMFVGIGNAGITDNHGVVFKQGSFYSRTVENGVITETLENGLSLSVNTQYIVELEIVEGGTRLYVYEKGQDQSSGIVHDYIHQSWSTSKWINAVDSVEAASNYPVAYLSNYFESFHFTPYQSFEDSSGRLQYEVDTQGVVRETIYDVDGSVIDKRIYDQKITLESDASVVGYDNVVNAHDVEQELARSESYTFNDGYAESGAIGNAINSMVNSGSYPQYQFADDGLKMSSEYRSASTSPRIRAFGGWYGPVGSGWKTEFTTGPEVDQLDFGIGLERNSSDWIRHARVLIRNGRFYLHLYEARKVWSLWKGWYWKTNWNSTVDQGVEVKPNQTYVFEHIAESNNGLMRMKVYEKGQTPDEAFISNAHLMAWNAYFETWTNSGPGYQNGGQVDPETGEVPEAQYVLLNNIIEVKTTGSKPTYISEGAYTDKRFIAEVNENALFAEGDHVVNVISSNGYVKGVSLTESSQKVNLKLHERTKAGPEGQPYDVYSGRLNIPYFDGGVEVSTGLVRYGRAQTSHKAILADGSYVWIWSSGGEVRTQKYTSQGVPIGDETVLASLEASSVSVHQLPAGGIYYQWTDIGGTVRGQYYSDAGLPGIVETLATGYGGSYYDHFKIIELDDGSLLAVISAGNAIFKGVKLSASGSIIEADHFNYVIPDTYRNDTKAVRVVPLSAANGGGFAMAWMDMVTFGEAYIYLQHFDMNGVAVGDKQLVTEILPRPFFPTLRSIAELDDGTLGFSWINENFNPDFVEFGTARFTLGSSFSSSDVVTTEVFPATEQNIYNDYTVWGDYRVVPTDYNTLILVYPVHGGGVTLVEYDYSGSVVREAYTVSDITVDLAVSNAHLSQLILSDGQLDLVWLDENNAVKSASVALMEGGADADSGSYLFGLLPGDLAERSNVTAVDVTVKNPDGSYRYDTVTTNPQTDLFYENGVLLNAVRLTDGFEISNGFYDIEVTVYRNGQPDPVIHLDNYQIGEVWQDYQYSWPKSAVDSSSIDDVIFKYRPAGSSSAYEVSPVQETTDSYIASMPANVDLVEYEYVIDHLDEKGNLLERLTGVLYPSGLRSHWNTTNNIASYSWLVEDYTIEDGGSNEFRYRVKGDAEYQSAEIIQIDGSQTREAIFFVQFPVEPATAYEFELVYRNALGEVVESYKGDITESLQANDYNLHNVSSHYDNDKYSGIFNEFVDVGSTEYEYTLHAVQIKPDVSELYSPEVVAAYFRQSNSDEYELIDRQFYGEGGMVSLPQLAYGDYDYQIIYRTDKNNAPADFKVEGSFTVDENGSRTDTCQIQNLISSRQERRFYDQNGRLSAVMDAEGYITEYSYNAQGKLITTHAYSSIVLAIDSEGYISDYYLLENGTLDQLRPAASEEDQYSHAVYNSKGQMIADVAVAGMYLDSTGVAKDDRYAHVTEYSYDVAGNLLETITYANAWSKAEYQSFVTSLNDNQGHIPDADWANLKPLADSQFDQTTSQTWNSRNLLETSTDIHGTVTRYSYNAAGQLINTVVAENAEDERQAEQAYNVFGEMTRSAVGEDVERDVDSRYVYDAAGRLAQTIDQEGNSQYFYYDELGRVEYTINGEGEVTQTLYNAFGEVEETIQYASCIDTADLAGGATSEAPAALTDLNAASNDNIVTEIRYTQRGQVDTVRDGENVANAITTPTLDYDYNAFGEVSILTKAIRLANGVTETQTQRFGYDHRGSLLVTQTLDDQAGQGLISQQRIDAFGRVVSTTDTNGNVSTLEYDPLGRLLRTTDAAGKQQTVEYDAFNRQVAMRQFDAVGNLITETRYIYDDQANTLTVVSGEGITTQTQYDVHGQVKQIELLGIEGQILSSYDYDASGRLLSETDGLNNSVGYQYDDAGNLEFITDKNGIVTQYHYDKANRSIKTVVDPDGLALTTETVFDAFGRRFQSILRGDANNADRIVETQYDHNGNVSRIVTDPGEGKLNLITDYEYNLANQLISEKHGYLNGVTATNTGTAVYERHTSYSYDAFGRLQESHVDPDGLDITTGYDYDANGNQIRVTDANGNTSHYVYDETNQLRFMLSPVSETELAVTEYQYDAQGNRIQTTRYMNGVAIPDSWNEGESAFDTSLVVTSSSFDQVTNAVYDKDSRLVYSVNASGAISSNHYDDRGNLTKTISFVKGFEDLGLIRDSLTQGGIETALATANAEADANLVEQYLYDAAGRRTHSINASGYVTQSVMDAAGNVTETYRYHNSVDTTLDRAALQTAVANLSTVEADISHYAYDAASRLVYQLDGVNTLTRYSYNSFGEQQTQTIFAVPYTATDYSLSALETFATVNTDAEYNGDAARLQSWEYDAAGRAIKHYLGDKSAQHILTAYEYDAVGNQVRTIQAADTINQVVSHNIYDAANRLIETVQGAVSTDYASVLSTYNSASKPDDLIRTQYVYDNLGNLTAKVDPRGVLTSGNSSDYVTRYFYDVAGNLVIEKNGDGQVTRYEYDVFGRLESTKELHVPLLDPDFNFRFRNVGQSFDYKIEIDIDDSIFDLVDILRVEFRSGEYTYSVDLSKEMWEGIYRETIEWGWANDYTPVSVTAIIADESYEFMSWKDGYSIDNEMRWIFDAVDKDLYADTRVTRHIYDRGTQREIYTVAPDGSVTENVYDHNGQLVTIIKHQEQLDLTGVQMDEQSIANELAKEYLPGQTAPEESDRRTDYVRNANGQVQFEITATGRITAYDYDYNGNIKSQTIFNLPYVRSSNAASITIQQVNDFLSSTSGLKYQKTVYKYNALGQKEQEIQLGENGEELATLTEYNAFGEQRKITDARALAMVNSDSDEALALRESLGIIITETDGTVRAKLADELTVQEKDSLFDYTQGLYSTEQSFDHFGRKIEEESAEGNRKTTEYDAFGNAVKLTDANGNSTYFYYDKLGRVKYQISAENNLTQYNYDQAGNVLSVSEYSNQVVVVNPDALPVQDLDIVFGAEQTQAGIYLLTHASDRTTSFTYNASNQQTSEKDALSYTSYTYYNAFGEVVREVDKRGFEKRYQYDDVGNLTEKTEVIDKATSSVVEKTVVTQYQHNAFGDIERMTEASGSEDQRITYYRYNAEGKLIRETKPSTNGYANTFADAAVPDVQFIKNTPISYTYTTEYRESYGDFYHYTFSFTDLSYAVDSLDIQFERDDISYYPLKISKSAFEDGDRVVTSFKFTVYDSQHSPTPKALYAETGHGRVKVADFEWKEDNNLGIYPDPIITARTGILKFPDEYHQYWNDGHDNASYKIWNVDDPSSVIEGRGMNILIPPEFTGENYRFEIRAEDYSLDGTFNRLTESVTVESHKKAVQTKVELDVIETTAYDAFGNVSKVITGNGYDTDQQVLNLGGITYVIKNTTANGSHQSYQYYDDFNRMIFKIEADGAINQYLYDAVGNLISERIYQEKTSVSMDALRSPTISDLLGDGKHFYRETRYKYDSDNRIVSKLTENVEAYQVGSPLQKQLFSYQEYDAVGNVISTTSAQGHKNYAYYDGDNRKAVEVDAEGYVTTYEYLEAGLRVVETKYATQFDYNWAETSLEELMDLVPYSATDNDRVTEYIYDGVGQLRYVNQLNVEHAYFDASNILVNVSAGDAQKISTEYQYDQEGNLLKKIDDQGNVESNIVDGLGRVTRKTSAAFVDYQNATRNQITSFDYDLLGNVIREVRWSASGESDGQEKTFKYDKAGNLIKKTISKKLVTYVDSYGESYVRWLGGDTEYFYYDKEGNLTHHRYGIGRTHQATQNYEYDERDRIVREYVSENQYREYTYNAFGEVETKTLVTDGVADLVNQEYFIYDAAGNLIRTNQDDGINKAYFYNADGVLTSKITLIVNPSDYSDPALIPDIKILSNAEILSLQPEILSRTDYQYDDRGNRIREIQYSHDNAIASNNSASAVFWFDATQGDSAGLLSIVPPSSIDLEKRFLKSPLLHLPDLSHYGSSILIDINGTEKVFSSNQQTIDLGVNGFNSWVPIKVYASVPSGQHILLAEFITADSQSVELPANINIQGVASNIATGSFTVLHPSTGFPLDVIDLSLIHDKNGNVVSGDLQGELVASGLRGNYPFTYTLKTADITDEQGNVIQSGFVQTYVKGQVKLANNGFTVLSQQLKAYLGNDAVVRKAYSYNAFDQIETEIDGTNYHKKDELTFQNTKWAVQSRIQYGYNADAAALTSADQEDLKALFDSVILPSLYTRYEYDQRGNLLKVISPDVMATDERGYTEQVTPTQRYFYDRLGRNIAVQDAAMYQKAQLDPTSTYYSTRYEYNALNQRTVEYYADGGKKRYGYDMFGNLRYQSTLISVADSGAESWRTLRYEYDDLGRVIKTILPVDSTFRSYILDETAAQGYRIVDNPSERAEIYQYDYMGNRIATRDARGFWTYNTYDSAGRLVEQQDAENLITRYSYVANAAAGEYVTTKLRADGLMMTDTFDGFGQRIAHTDLGGRSYEYDYNTSGWLIRQTSTAGQDISYQYYQSGLIKQINDNGLANQMQTNYQYDASGNRIVEAYSSYNGNGYSLLQNAHASYDSMGRITRIDDSGAQGFVIDYLYDINGNRRNIHADYGDGQTQDSWYLYDEMNRFTTAQGVLTGSEDDNPENVSSYDNNAIVVNEDQGYIIGYNEGNERISQERFKADGSLVHRETYSYNAGGMLQNTYLEVHENDGSVATYRTSNKKFDMSGNVLIAEEESISNERERRVATGYDYIEGDYDGTKKTVRLRSRLLKRSEFVDLLRKSDRYLREYYKHDYYSYNEVGELLETTSDLHDSSMSGYQGHEWSSNTYTYWDQAKTQVVSFASQAQNQSQITGGGVRYFYDVNGHVKKVTDPGYQHSDTGFEQVGRTLDYIQDQQGRILQRNETYDDGRAGNTHYYHYFNGIAIGDHGTGGVHTSRQDYAAQMAYEEEQRRKQEESKSGHHGIEYSLRNFKYQVKAIDSSDFDYNYSPINQSSGLNEAKSYQVQYDGETFNEIATKLWGDGSLWYLLADANGYPATSDPGLKFGQLLNVPNAVTNIYNNSETFKPYDPTERLGNVQPSIPIPEPKAEKEKCGVEQLLVVVVTVVVAVVVGSMFGPHAGLTTFEKIGVAMLAATAGNAAGQLTAMALGLRDDFSFSEMRDAAISSLLTVGVSSALQVNTSWFGNLSKFEQGFVSTALATATGSVAGPDSMSFSWRDVMIQSTSDQLLGDLGLDGSKPMNLALHFEASTIKTAVAALIKGKEFEFDGASWAGSAIGGAIGGNIKRSILDKSRTPKISRNLASIEYISASADDSELYWNSSLEKEGKYYSQGYDENGSNYIRMGDTANRRPGFNKSPFPEQYAPKEYYIPGDEYMSGWEQQSQIDKYSVDAALDSVNTWLTENSAVPNYGYNGDWVNDTLVGINNTFNIPLNALWWGGSAILQSSAAADDFVTNTLRFPQYMGGMTVGLPAKIGGVIAKASKTIAELPGRIASVREVNRGIELRDPFRSTVFGSRVPGTQVDNLPVAGNKQSYFGANVVPKKLPNTVSLNSRADFRAASKNPQPNTTYEFDGFTYVTDDLGRGVSSSGQLRLNGGGNRFYDDRLIGHQGNADDIAFHAGADQFGFQGGALNLSPGNKFLNNREYASFERDLKGFLQQGQTVNADFRQVFYPGNKSLRPDEYVVLYRVGDGDVRTRTFLNQEGGGL